ncbi:MAG TPA: aminotransferase class IV [Anaerolineaceae bacterium]|nr:aminotransferase class IV [Anaerolineaceae bacterium]
MSSIAVWKVETNQPLALTPIEFTPPVTTLDQASGRLPGGAYTTFRTYGSDNAHHVGAHLSRLAETTAMVQPSVHLDLDRIRAATRQALAAGDGNEKRVRLTIDLEDQLGVLYIFTEPLKVPSAQQYNDGVGAISRRLDRHTPKAKLTTFIGVADQVRGELTNGLNEVLMVDEQGRILEGISSNFFGVKDHEIWTADKEVLSGITRSIVLEEAERAGLVVHLDALNLEEVYHLDEAFITSSSRAVLPLTRIDGKLIGQGKPGALTRLLMERYDQRIQAEIELI